MARDNEPTQIPSGGENVFAWSRQNIQDAFQGLDTTDAQHQAQQYGTAASDWDQGLETFKRSVGASISEAWEGASADSAKTAITQYTTDAANLTDLLSGISQDIKAAGLAVVETKKGIQPAAQHSWTTNIPFFGRAQARSEENTRTQNEADTREAMQRNYVTQFGKCDNTVPVVPPSLNPLNPAGATGPGVTGPGGATGPGGGPGGVNPTGASGPTGSTGPGDGASGPGSGASGPGSGASGPGSDSAGTQNTSPSSAKTTPSSVDPTATAPSSVAPSSYTSPGTAGLGTAGGMGGLGGGGGETGSGSGGLGRSIPGTGTPGANPAAAAAAAARAGTSATGMGGMGGMGAAGKGKEGEGDGTHKRADYLVNAENAEELIGELPRTVPGGVIGGDFRDDRPDAEE